MSRIAGGQKIKTIPINSESDLEKARNEYYKWDSFNEDLLRKLFDSTEVADRYGAWIGIAAGPEPFHLRVRDHSSDLDERIHRLETIVEKLSLYDEPERTDGKAAEPAVIGRVKPERIFISHGRSQDWLSVQTYIERDLSLSTLELAQEANRGRTVLQKLWDESNKCSYAVVVMTGDDHVADGQPRARENVLHEIGFFQGRFGLENVCLLYEAGTNVPSNIHGLVYIEFPKGVIKATFGELQRELRAAFSK